MKQYTSITGLGLTRASTDEIILTIYGPRGGMRATESMTVDTARKLATALNTAASKFPSAALVNT